MSVDVRPATDDDVDAVVDLFRQYLRFYDQDVPDAEARAYLAARRASGDSVLLVAVLTPEDGETPSADTAEGELVGFAQSYPTWSSVSLSRSWVLNDLFVSPAARGTGAGRALVQDTCRRAKDAGAIRVSLATAWDNVAAQGLYESEGFVRDQHFHHYAYVTGA
ncbi:GNAT family N-acetyltransferase [Promicromonospora sp. NPDC057138]|uniref:GNAT family N-acetyltransferase n=1 Tax=Promicromonospora sp. NPDC057138 TaxID=3346031 RepID=UPI00362DF750